MAHINYFDNNQLNYIQNGDVKLPFHVKRSLRAKRISLRISPARNEVIVTIPKRASLKAGMDFLQSKLNWILANTSDVIANQWQNGSKINILGKEYIIENIAGRGITKIENDKLVVHGATEFIKRRIIDFTKKLLYSHCKEQAVILADKINKKVGLIKIINAKLRWGSCSINAALSFNYLLIFAPINILQYVIAHEVAHLQEMNHSSKFWEVVEKIYPDYKNARKWLKQNGGVLYQLPN
jgi:predicted metal-dependent hydrolase